MTPSLKDVRKCEHNMRVKCRRGAAGMFIHEIIIFYVVDGGQRHVRKQKLSSGNMCWKERRWEIEARETWRRG